MAVKRVAIGNGKYCYSGPNCRLHGVSQIANAKQALFVTESEYDNARNIAEKDRTDFGQQVLSKATVARDEARKLYDATTEGQAKLREIINRFDPTIQPGEPLYYARRDFERRLADAENYATAYEAANGGERDWEEKPDENGLVGINLATSHTYEESETTEVNPGMYSARRGAKYSDKWMSVTEIKKNIASDIKDAIAANYLPANLHYSITTSKYSGGQSLTVEVQGVRDSARQIPDDVENRRWGGYTPEAKELDRRLQGIVDNYNSISSHPEIDYSNVRFYGHVSIEHESERDFRLKQAEVAKLKRSTAKVRTGLVSNLKKSMSFSKTFEAEGLKFQSSNKSGVEIARVPNSDLYVARSAGKFGNPVYAGYDLAGVSLETIQKYRKNNPPASFEDYVADGAFRDGWQKNNFLRNIANTDGSTLTYS